MITQAPGSTATPELDVTTSERDSVSDVKEGTIIFNTTTNKFQGYDGTDWVDLH